MSPSSELLSIRSGTARRGEARRGAIIGMGAGGGISGGGDVGTGVSDVGDVGDVGGGGGTCFGGVRVQAPKSATAAAGAAFFGFALLTVCCRYSSDMMYRARALPTSLSPSLSSSPCIFSWFVSFLFGTFLFSRCFLKREWV